MADRSRSRSPVSDRERKRSRSHSPRRPRNMTSKRCIISNIPYDLKWQEIKDIFRNEVGDVVYVELFNNPDGKPKGTGVIEFRDIETAALAIEKMHRYEIKDRKLVVREERERERRQNEMMSNRGGGGGGQGVMGPSPRNLGGMGGGGGGMGGGMGGMNSGISPQILQQLGIEGPLSNTVFVSNLDYKVTWKKLKDVFKLAGNVMRAEIMEDKVGKSRGFGTVAFETQMEAVQAISMFNGQTLYDRTMRVKMDNPNAGKQEPLPDGLKGLGPSLNNLQHMSSSDIGMGMGSGMGMGGMGNMDRMGSMGMSGMGGMGNMGGMGTGMSGMGVGMGSSMSGNMTGMGNMGAMGTGLGMGDNFSSGMTGMGTSNMGSGSMGSSGLSDSFGMSNMASGMGGSSGFSSMMDSSRSSGMSNYSSGMSSYGRDSGRSSSSNLPQGDMKTRADKSTVIVKNLPYSVDWQTLKSKFSSVGDIRFAEISKNDKGKSNGWGLVSFRREEDAQLAVQRMNRVDLEGRDIVVKLLN